MLVELHHSERALLAGWTPDPRLRTAVAAYLSATDNSAAYLPLASLHPSERANLTRHARQYIRECLPAFDEFYAGELRAELASRGEAHRLFQAAFLRFLDSDQLFEHLERRGFAVLNADRLTRKCEEITKLYLRSLAASHPASDAQKLPFLESVSRRCLTWLRSILRIA